MSRERVAWFGGSFDPPHVGHVAIARAAMDRVGLNEVLFMPTGRQPFKPGGAEAPFEDRLRMVELLCAGKPGWRSSALDSPRADGQVNYTVDVLQALRGARPEAELFGLIGADSVTNFGKWHRLPELLALAEWIVVSRPGFARPEMPPAAKVHWVDDVQVPVESHVLRDMMHAGVTCDGLMPDSVLHYIRKQGLYQTSSNRE